MKAFKFLFVFLMTFSLSLQAAPVPSSSICDIIATIISYTKRTHRYEPEDWRKSWGLPETREYIDVTLEVKSAKLIGNGSTRCEVKEFKGKIFQLKEVKDQEKLKKGLCLSAKTQMSGDEFAIGQWLWDIRSCQTGL